MTTEMDLSTQSFVPRETLFSNFSLLHSLTNFDRTIYLHQKQIVCMESIMSHMSIRQGLMTLPREGHGLGIFEELQQW